MDFVGILKKPWEWIFGQPALLLAAVPSLIPSALFFIALHPLLEKIVKLASRSNLTEYLLQNMSVLISKALPYLGLFVLFAILQFLFQLYSNAAFAHIAKTLRAGKNLNLSESFASAKGNYVRYLIRFLAADVALIASFLALALFSIPFVLVGMAVPPLGFVFLILGVVLAVVLFFVGMVVLTVGFPLVLPASVYGKASAFDTIRGVLEFIRRHKLNMLLFAIALWIVNSITSELAGAFWQYLWLMLPFSMLLGMIATSWTMLSACLLWLEGSSESSALPQKLKK